MEKILVDADITDDMSEEEKQEAWDKATAKALTEAAEKAGTSIDEVFLASLLTYYEMRGVYAETVPVDKGEVSRHLRQYLRGYRYLVTNKLMEATIQ